jgi:type I restriction enzyme S subunit
MTILLPPINEQNAIVNYIDKKSGQIDNQVSLLKEKIDLLHEQRESLIFNIASGKLEIGHDDE